jgi:hypothetical protein
MDKSMTQGTSLELEEGVIMDRAFLMENANKAWSVGTAERSIKTEIITKENTKKENAMVEVSS